MKLPIKQYKGKDLADIPVSQINEESMYYGGLKYDGNYIQICKRGNLVDFYTSGGKCFQLQDLENELIKLNPSIDFVLECEYIADTDGKLGSRGKCTTTTFRTNTAKGIVNKLGSKHFKCFDVLYLQIGNVTYLRPNSDTKYEDRLLLRNRIKLPDRITKVAFKHQSFKEHFDEAQKLCVDGWEGLFLFKPEHKWRSIGRSNQAIKLKQKPTADAVCTKVNYSEINPADIGSMVVVDEKGRQCNVGGFTHDMKQWKPEQFIGRKVEFTYESMGPNTYLQPRFKCFRSEDGEEQK
jgi:ATP-dependent DNA ligase